MGEKLKGVYNIDEPDFRSNIWIRFDDKSGQQRHVELKDHISDIAQFKLGSSVPEGILDLFITAQNLYIYSWYHYPLRVVAEFHVLTVLELALKERLFPDKRSRPKRTSLHKLFSCAIEEGYLVNERLSQWRRIVEKRFQQRIYSEKFAKALQSESPIGFNLDDAQPNQEDLNFDYLQILREYFPKLRNQYAHGSESLYPHVLLTFEVVSELINQLFGEEKRVKRSI